VDERLLGYLRREMRLGRLCLFMGAGFSAETRDAAGRKLPTGPQLADELWQLCFPGEPRDRSRLADLFEHALGHCRDGLEELIAARLRVDAASLPAHFETWFRMPWRRAYTLNVDDVEEAAEARFDLPREVVSMSALRSNGGRACGSRACGDVLEVVHLNGVVGHGCEHITFSTIQYGDRLAAQDPCYRRLVADLKEYPFLCVGTRLDEAPLWRHLRARDHAGQAHGDADRPLSFIVTPKLERARQSLLDDMHIKWIPMTAGDFARRVLVELEDAVEPGLSALRAADATAAPDTGR
jgi:hypothetical protein